MRKLGIVSLTLAALLLSGCNQKSEEQKAEVQKVEQAAPTKIEQSVVKEKPVAKEVSAPKEAPAPKENMKESAPAGDQAPQQIKESKEDVAKEAQSATQAAKESAKQEVKEAKETVAAKAEEAKAEVKAAVDGAKLYAKCASCHGPKGDRKALGKSAVIAGMAKDEVLKKLQGYQAGTLNQYGMGPLMKGQVAGLSEADLEALADYIAKLK